jgi:replication factor C subunit 2/4
MATSRPRTIDDISSQEHAVAVLRKTLQSANVWLHTRICYLSIHSYSAPSSPFLRPTRSVVLSNRINRSDFLPGTGKTSTILALARQLFGPENFRHRVLELNASDERGISIIREKIKDFARQTPRAAMTGPDGITYPCPPYKIIILDEADSMTQDAQGALRRIMETYARITRFCLVCNYVTRIIEPVASRCSKFRFRPLDDTASYARLSHIASQEQVEVSEDVLRTVLKTSGGDLRRAITYLQSASRLASSGIPPTPITSRDIQEIAGVVPDELILQLGCELGMDPPAGLAGLPSRARSFDQIQERVRRLILNGYPASQILVQVGVSDAPDEHALTTCSCTI